MVNFNIKNGSYTGITDEQIPLIKIDYYVKKMSVKAIKEKYGLTRKQWYNVRELLHEEYGERETFLSNPRYYYKMGNKYRVSKTINNRCVVFGDYSSRAVAKEIVRKLILVDWDKRQLKRIQSEVME